jgi:hypothetical protein
MEQNTNKIYLDGKFFEKFILFLDWFDGLVRKDNVFFLVQFFIYLIDQNKFSVCYRSYDLLIF